jgi:hypothetical protein
LAQQLIEIKQLGQFHTLTSAYALTGRVGLETDDFIFSIVNFPFECNSNLEAPAGGVYISYFLNI